MSAVTGRSTDGVILPMSVVSLMGWNHGGFQAPDPPSEGIVGPGELAGLAGLHDHGHDDHGHDDGLSTTPGQWRSLAEGFRLIASDAPGLLTEIGFASIADLGLTGDDLSPATLRRLDAAGELVRLPFDPIPLDGGEDLVVVTEGLVDDLPRDLLASGDYLLTPDRRFGAAMDRGEVLVYARTSGAAGSAWSFSLLNEAPIVGGQIPEPSAVALAVIGAFSHYRRRR